MGSIYGPPVSLRPPHRRSAGPVPSRGQNPDIPEGIIAAFREVLLNAMEYGAHFDPSQHVEISFIRARRMVACRVKDPGQGFSLEELRHTAINNPPDDLLSHFAVREAQGLRPGGFGLLLAKKLVDELIHSEQGNEVLLVKYVDPPLSQAGSDNARDPKPLWGRQ